MSEVTIEEATERLGELVRTTPIGQEVILVQDGRPVARLVPIAPLPGPVARRGFAKGQVLYMAPDFDETPSEFGEYIA
ncbi:MAG TPA: type II toxin-antitoxin system prevent-host-death family antitoxin [Armatimonadota bacterium]|nr:type II toxin-antitoxin system prevent-host-death family antitoxin [Armatimonadota bacterium]